MAGRWREDLILRVLPMPRPPCAEGVGRGTARSAVEGPTAPESPSTMLRMVPLPIRVADREDEKNHLR
jgi:hypothetical protein